MLAQLQAPCLNTGLQVTVALQAGTMAAKLHAVCAPLAKAKGTNVSELQSVKNYDLQSPRLGRSVFPPTRPQKALVKSIAHRLLGHGR